MVVTEICTFSLSPSTTVSQLSDPAGIHIAGTKTVRSQPGCLALFWGVGIIDTSKLYWIVEWDSLASHQAFTLLPSYPPFVQSVLPLADPSSASPISLTHYQFPTPLSTLFKSFSQKPLLELFEITKQPQLPPSSVTDLFDELDKGLKVFDDKGPIPAVYGFSIDEGSQDKLVSVILWRDGEQHGKFLAGEVFGATAPKMGGVVAGPPVVNHVDLKEWQ